jgi:hypothetical protein
MLEAGPTLCIEPRHTPRAFRIPLCRDMIASDFREPDALYPERRMARLYGTAWRGSVEAQFGIHVGKQRFQKPRLALA